ncbi:MAG TPA: OB-fold nucleic acid binding domain-containing protein [Alphaproteobacteria bacterium]|nr:OB-fold nucleic acid binding domain-containing protein [Alphaproteobacteria bacterium]
MPSCLSDVPPEDPAVYDMICRADTVGVFQIESRAQMSMLPRLKPRNFYDLVIEVAIVRPGPIQGGMVHPYLRRRNGEEPITYPNEAIKEVLERTLGVPLFQEQAMKLAIVAAGFTPGEADQLRRAMAAWRRNGHITRFRDKLINGMKSNGLSEEFAQRCFEQICGFGEYGFPESHAASFALLVYVSCWLKRYHPAAFCAAMINSQPLGFYQPAQLVRDARQHGVTVLPVDVNHSGYDCRLEETGRAKILFAQQHRPEGARSLPRTSVPGCRQLEVGNRKLEIDNPSLWGAGGPAVRLGMRLIKGISEEKVAGIERAQHDRPFRSVTDLFRRSGASRVTLARLAAADAMRSLGLNRREAVWQVLALSDRPPLFEQLELNEPAPNLPKHTQAETVFEDYATVGLSLEAHPISLIRKELSRLRVQPNRVLKHARQGQRVRVAGLALVRQRPSTAGGITFCTLEDETGTANLIIRPKVFEKHRSAAARVVAVVAQGYVERQGEVVHVQVNRIEDLSKALAGLKARSRDFH